jgi:hypothetical protein
MKKIMLIPAVMLLTAVTGYTQSKADTRPRFGIKGGFNAANITIDNEGTIKDKKAVGSFHVGAYADLPLLPILSIQPGVFVSGKGSKYTVGDNESNNYTEVSTRPLYLEVPVNAVIKIPIVNNVRLFAGAGPYGAIGIGGKNKLEGKLAGIAFSDEESIKYGNDDPQSGSNGNSYSGDLKRFDFGVNVLAGIEISRLTLNANYGHGFVNIKPGSDNDSRKYQNRVFSVAIGFLL